VAAAFVAFALTLAVEQVVYRPRPFVDLGFEPLFPHARDSSVPSDHTLIGVALGGPMLARDRRLGLLLVGWALIVGVARIAAGVHYPSDIVGSGIIALALDWVVWLALRPLQRWDGQLLGSRRGGQPQ
jgi:undecaprenyl-diphosphatase